MYTSPYHYFYRLSSISQNSCATPNKTTFIKTFRERIFFVPINQCRRSFLSKTPACIYHNQIPNNCFFFASNSSWDITPASSKLLNLTNSSAAEVCTTGAFLFDLQISICFLQYATTSSIFFVGELRFFPCKRIFTPIIIGSVVHHAA